MAHDTRFLSRPGADLAYEDRGDGRPALFLHGFAGSRRSWDPIWNAVAPGRRAIRMDLRGFGASQPLDDTPYAHADDIEGLLDHLGIETLDLVATSLGAAIAMGFALTRPERVRRLVLVAPTIAGWPWSAAWRRAWRDVTGRAKAGDIDGAKALWFAHPLFAPARRDAASAAVLEEAIAAYSGAHWRGVDPQRRPEAADLDRLAELTMPVLLLSGALDLPDFRDAAACIEANVSVERIDLPDTGHLIMLEQPRELAAAINRFLAEDG